MIDGPSAIAFSDVHGLNRNPRVNMSESERMPGYLNRSQVPPRFSRRSRIDVALVGAAVLQVPGRADAGDAGPDDDNVDKFGHDVKLSTPCRISQQCVENFNTL